MVLLQIFIQAFTSLLNSSKQLLLAYSAFALFYPCIMFLKNILVQFFMAKSTKFISNILHEVFLLTIFLGQRNIVLFFQSQILRGLILKILVICDLRGIFLGS